MNFKLYSFTLYNHLVLLNIIYFLKLQLKILIMVWATNNFVKSQSKSYLLQGNQKCFFYVRSNIMPIFAKSYYICPSSISLKRRTIKKTGMTNHNDLKGEQRDKANTVTWTVSYFSVFPIGDDLIYLGYDKEYGD